MFYYTPASRLSTSYRSAPPQFTSPRDRYLRALAEAEAAEAEYLVVEAAQREEDQLLRRLAELNQEKHLRSRHDLAPLDNYLSYDRFAVLRQQVEEEERLRLLAFKEADFAERRRQEQAALELEAVRRRRAHEEAILLCQQEQREQARLRALYSYNNQAFRPYRQVACQKPRNFGVTPALHPSVQFLLGPEAKVVAPVESKRQVKQEESDAVQRQSAPKPKLERAQKPASKPSQDANVLDVQKYLELFFKPLGASLDQLRQPASQTTPSSEEAALDESTTTLLLQEFAKLLVPPTAEETSASSSSSKAAQDAAAEGASSASALTPVTPKAQTTDTSNQSLMEQLEARLNNDADSELQDTIQAILESLRDAENTGDSAQTSSSSTGAASSSKGKAKADESSPTTTSAPTSKNIVDSLDQVRNIETAFHTLEADFVFPATLDFLPSHLDSPVSPGSGGSSATTHLTYSPRNQPVRFYEQSLTALLAQLDLVDSFGNDALRATRKEVVDRIEEALDELEREVEGRYRSRLAKESKAKSVRFETTAVAAPEVPTTVTDSASAVPEPKPELEESEEEESVSASTVPSEPTPTATATSPEEPSSELSEPSSPTGPIAPEVELEPVAPVDIPTNTSIADESSLSSSSVTVKGYEVETEDDTSVSSPPSDVESSDMFLLTTEPENLPKRPTHKDSDVASDWSEVEA